MTVRRSGTNTYTVLVSLLASAILGPTYLAAQDSVEFSRWYQGLRDLRPDPTRGAEVQGLTLTRDAGTFRFLDGQIHLLEPIDGRTIGAVFVGQGLFEMAAPEAVEQDQLRRTYGVAAIATTFRAAVLLFTDSTASELDEALPAWGPLEPDREAEREVREARDYFTDGDGWVDRKVMLPLINEGPGFFYAHFSEDRGDPMIFSVDPLVFEEVSLSQRTDRGKRREVVAQFHQQADYATGASAQQEDLDLIRITSYDIETSIEGNLDLVGRATATLLRLAPTYDWIPFSLFPELEVDSIRWGDGSPVDFYRADDVSDLWVDFSTAPAEESQLTFHYSGDMLEKIERQLWIALGTHTTWYPVYEFGREIPYSLTFHTPDQYVVTTVGTKLSQSTEDDVTTSEWRTAPVRLLTFNIGEFDEFVSEVEGAPNVSVLINEQAHRSYGASARQRGRLLLTQENMAETVAGDLTNSFRFYNEVYGLTTVQDFVATEIPYSHGEAYRGLIMLAWSTFQWSSEKGFDDMFRAHEVAHQWWGISVRPATYRDWWLAEGFSEFSGWWYAARAFGSIDMYHRRLKETREDILDRRDESAPVGLGQRTRSSEHPEDYQLMVYYKGAWVLHMLRTMLTDPDTGNDDLFTEIMRTFYTDHLGGMATTLQFQQTVEQVVGTEMGWFFDQWIYGSSIPTYTFSHTFTDEPGGVKATVRIRQENVPEDFRMIVPILLDFGDEGSALVPVNVVGPVTEVELPLLPREPDDIVFNPYESVLAETKTERWRN